uniref:NADH-ubiquinone oxidoreductase chain 5 n=1 Tax=Crotalus horridus TaxID=35024 RepID=E0ADZ0_CROHD|nr:NADH dehydrogenase subunit 5 [Crotalus horridus]
MGLTTPTIILTIFLSLITSTIRPTTKHSLNNTKYTLMLMFMISLIPLNTMLNNNSELTMTLSPLITTQTENIYITITLDVLSLTFIPVMMYITWSITEFSIWYMSSDPNINKFIKYLMTFLITMMIMITANNMYQLFIGWEGVGVMSFLLIGWWNARSSANTAALQAMIYNRIGDMGIILTTAWLITFSSMNVQELLIQYETVNLIPTIGLMAAATGKSAQFSLHPWLPAAMGGPTPVSALLHSSTMVVAGVFLLIRLHPILNNSDTMKTMCLLLGATTTMFAAAAAITQHDIKKIIALSTTSQLGLMMTMLGLNQPALALLHMTMHFFFKALLFLCSGSFIHNLNNKQDIRMMGNMLKTTAMTASFTTIASLSLFLSGFYSKDTIIETMAASHVNLWALTTTLICAILSAAYSMQIILLVLTGPTRTTNPHKESKNTILPLMRLTTASIIIGSLTKLTPLQTPPLTTMPKMVKLMAMTMTILGVIVSKDLMQMTQSTPPQKPQTIPLFFNQLAFFNMPHRAVTMNTLKSSQQISTELMDLWTLETYGPKGLSKTFTQLATLSTQQKNMIKNYVTTFTLTLFISMALIPT